MKTRTTVSTATTRRNKADVVVMRRSKQNKDQLFLVATINNNFSPSFEKRDLKSHQTEFGKRDRRRQNSYVEKLDIIDKAIDSQEVADFDSLVQQV
mmetsp:Transcript_11788/g.13381  ORF Transcript_11788/g.13381 Transcript_11788/m.13381 type:complete len:96 (+) Transcript_11788:333-620(+)